MSDKNKYQVALDNILLDINEGVIYSTDLMRLLEDLKTLRELADKDTPMEPTKKEDIYDSCEYVYTRGVCPNCKEWIVSTDEYEVFNYCPYCGQAIDFGGEYEE